MRRKRTLVREVKNVTNLLDEKLVEWAEEQKPLIRTKRDWRHQHSSRQTGDFLGNLLDKTRQFVFSIDLSPKSNTILNRYNDELWPFQWYIHSQGLARFDHGITKVWDMGFTGKGVVVTVLDDGQFPSKISANLSKFPLPF